MQQEHLSWMRQYLNEMYKTHILENFLEITIDRLEEGKVIYQTKTLQEHSNIYGFAHGGTLASISDIVMGVSCLTYGKRVVTIDMNVSYIKSAPIGDMLTAVGIVISNGKTIMRSTGEIFSNEQLIARSQASYFVTGDFNENDCPAIL